MENAVPETDTPRLSVIIPAYNEEARAADTLRKIESYFSATKKIDYEIIVINDGCDDGTVDAIRGSGVEATLLSNEGNMGKGASVRKGVGAARGELCLVMDMDMPVGLEALDAFVEKIESGADIAAATRYSSGSEYVGPGFPRMLFSRIFNAVTRIALGLPFSDTQCGFKLMRTELAARIMRECEVNRFAFDAEFLYRAMAAGANITEIPVKCVNPPESKVRLFRDSLEMFRDVMKVKKNSKSLTHGR